VTTDKLSIFSKKNVPVFIAYLILVAVAPLVIQNNYYLDVLIKSTYFMVMAVSLSILVGHLGMLSLAHPAFFGFGAYASALLSVKIGVPVFISMILAGILGAILAFLVAIPLMKLNYHSFAIGTLAFLMILKLAAANWVELTRGPLCLTSIEKPSLSLFKWSFDFSSDLSNYFIILTIAALTMVVTFLIIKSRFGRALNAIRNDEPLALSAGVNSYRYKIIAFTLSAIFPAVAGGFYAHYMTVVCPKIFDFHYVIYLLIMVIIGGASSLTGVIAASYLFTLLPETLRVASEFRDFVYGIMLTIFVIFLPGGIWPQLEAYYTRLKRRKSLDDIEG
jgi:branched-chain amino acid transport system permease protein